MRFPRVPMLTLVCGLALAAPLTTQQEREWRTRIKAALFVPQPLPALNARIHSRFEPAEGVVAERITYGTQFDMRVPAVLYLPKVRNGRIPALIVVNGHGGDKYSWASFYAGILYAGAGAAVLTYDPVGEGERNIDRKSGTRAHDKLENPEELGRRMGGLMMTDVMQAVSYLSQRPEVDARRIGAMGNSMGSFVLSLACAVETRIHACVLAGGGNLDGPGEYWDTAKPMCQAIPYKSLMFLGDRGAALYALHASRGPTFVYNGLRDAMVAITTHGEDFFAGLQKRTAALRGSSKGVFETGFLPDGNHRPYFINRPAALWLERHLDFPKWTAEKIRALPERPITEWYRESGRPPDRFYLDTSVQTGGLAEVLGSGVPDIPRQDLTVLPPGEWEAQRERFIYEAWMRHAKEALRSGRPQ
jgi:dienelactone hydrolase